MPKTPSKAGAGAAAEAEAAAAAAAARVADGRAWREFCAALQRAGAAVQRPGTPQSAFHRAEGYRYLTRLLRAGLESFVESGDPRYPRFFQLSNETIKIGNDNPDNIYHNANVAGAYRYRIRGNRGDIPYLTFGTKGGGYESDGRMTPTGQLDLENIACDANGDFEITVAVEKQPGNWLPMQAHTNSMVVRQTFNNRKTERPAQYQIECLNPDAPDTLQPAHLESALQRAAAFVDGTANLFVDWMNQFAAHQNALPPNDQNMCQQAGGDSNIYYHNSAWALAADEALLVEFTPPECATWNFQLSNFWMESLDYRYHQIHVNKFSAQYEANGAVRICVAHAPPPAGLNRPAANWLQTYGHNCGAMLLRYVGAREFPPVQTRVLKLAELR